jgi:hypothetical protein
MVRTRKPLKRLEPKFQLVDVKWVDSTTIQSWERPGNLTSGVPVTLESKGVLSAWNDDCIVVSAAHNPENHEVCSSIAIPLGCIKSIKEI